MSAEAYGGGGAKRELEQKRDLRLCETTGKKRERNNINI